MTTAVITIGNTEQRFGQDRWSTLITLVDIELSTGGDSPITDRVGPLHAAPTAAAQVAAWQITMATTMVLTVQARLTRIAAAYPELDIMWLETTPRRIHPAPPDTPLTDQPTTGPTPGPATP